MTDDPWARFLDVQHELEGWWDAGLCPLLRAVAELHAARGVAGWIVELGVYRGRSLAALALMAGEGDHVLGLDCFELAHWNTSNSGVRASLAATRRALALVGIPEDRVSLVTKDLAQLDAAGLETLLQGLPGGYRTIRIAHIDAGHHFQNTKRDLETVAPHLDDLGLILLDDVFNHQWPEVALAFAHFLTTYAGWDVVGCLHSRVLLVRADAAPLYRELLEQLMGSPWQTFRGRPYFVMP